MAKGRPRRAVQGLGASLDEQAARVLTNDRFAPDDFLPALLEIIVGDGLEVIDVIEVNVLQKVDLGVDVARHGDVDEQQRAVAAQFHQRLEPRAIEHVMRRGGAADDDIDLLKLAVPFIEVHGAPAAIRSASATARSWERLETMML